MCTQAWAVCVSFLITHVRQALDSRLWAARPKLYSSAKYINTANMNVLDPAEILVMAEITGTA